MTDWARKRAEDFHRESCDCPDKSGRKKHGQGAYRRFYCVGCLAAALDAAREEGRKEGEERGAERERRGCWEEAAESETANEAAARISQRGPMRGPEEEILARAEKAEAQPQEAELRYAREFATRVDFQRAEKAEQERDDWRAAATTHIETIGILSDQKIQLQADLDAALDWIAEGWSNAKAESWARILALLEKRRANK